MDTDKALEEVANGDIEKELNTTLPGSEPLKQMEAQHEGGLEYTVVSARNGKPSIHYVSLGETPTCTCSDYRGNKKNNFTGSVDDDREPCSHIIKAALSDTMDPDELATRELINTTAMITNAAGEARKAADEARSTARELDNGLTRIRDAEAGATAEANGSTTSEPEEEHEKHSNDEKAREAAERLQEAFDEVIDGMEVEYNEGMVWVNKTPGAPDELPGPGNVDVFEAFLQNPEEIEYIYDDHEYAGAEPGDYFQNMIEPENVKGYISGVLK